MRSLMREVAKRAGVSNTTVSRVLNDVDVKIAPETRQRVRRVAAELGYRPNRTARTLVTGRTETIALCVTNMHSMHVARVISAGVAEISRHSYDVVVSEMHVLPGGKIDTSKLLSLPVDGTILADLPHGMMPDIEDSLIWGKPFVNMGAYVVDTADFVHVDLLSGTREAISHLRDIGCRRIAYLVPDWLEWFREHKDERLCGYDESMAMMGRDVEYVLAAGGASRRDSAPALKAHFERYGRPDGLYCFNDEMAVGALRALADMGMRVPEDIAVVGCDGIEETAYHNPTLSTVSMPMAQMCAKAWELLERRLHNSSLPLQQIALQPTLEVRGSSRR